MNPCPLILLMTGLLAIVCLLYGFFLEPRWVRVRTFTLPAPKDEVFRGSRLVYFSDLHTGSSTGPGALSRKMRAIMAQEPDAILFGGDLVEERTPIRDPAFRAMVVQALASLEAPLGKWAVLGNHDVEAPRFRRWVTGVLEEAGFILLENQGTEIAGLPVWGFADTHHSQPRYRPNAAETFTLFLVHESDWFPEALPQKNQGLILAGHSHYGQVTLFGLPLIRPAGARRYWRGSYRLGDNLTMIVSAGLGTVHIHARFFARPDVLALRLGDE